MSYLFQDFFPYFFETKKVHNLFQFSLKDFFDTSLSNEKASQIGLEGFFWFL